MPPSRTRKEAAAIKLVALPREILDHIFDCCEQKKIFETISDRHPINDEYPLLKGLRLVNRFFNALASSRLFKTVTLYQHAGYWERLNNIANNPNLADHVENIRIADIDSVLCIDDYDSWEQAVARERGGCGDSRLHPAAGGPLAKWDYSPQAWWLRYQRWRDAEVVMPNHGKAGTAPKVDIDRLRNLRSVETIGLPSLRVIERNPEVTRYGRLVPGRPDSIRFFETGFPDQELDFHPFELERDPQIQLASPMVAMRLFDLYCDSFVRNEFLPKRTHLQTMMIALHVCGKDLTKLTLHGPHELVNLDEEGPGLPSLKHLVVDTTSAQWHLDLTNSYWNSSTWVLGLRKLETLELRQCPDAVNNPDLCHFLRDAVWPNLRRMELKWLETSVSNLYKFVSTHWVKLGYLSISEPLVEQEDWDKFRKVAAQWSRKQGHLHLSLSEEVYVRTALDMD